MTERMDEAARGKIMILPAPRALAMEIGGQGSVFLTEDNLMVQANSSQYASMRTFRIEERDLVVVRLAHDRVPQWWVENLAKMFKVANPKWRGAMVVLDVDQDLSMLPEKKALELYKTLKSRFEPKHPKRGRRT